MPWSGAGGPADTGPLFRLEARLDQGLPGGARVRATASAARALEGFRVTGARTGPRAAASELAVAAVGAQR